MKNDELDLVEGLAHYEMKKETPYGVRARYGGARPLLELYHPLE
jgi:hypothetical protein